MKAQKGYYSHILEEESWTVKVTTDLRIASILQGIGI